VDTISVEKAATVKNLSVNADMLTTHEEEGILDYMSSLKSYFEAKD